MSNEVDWMQATRSQRRESKAMKIKQQLNYYFFYPSSLDRVHGLSLRKANYPNFVVRNNQIAELENSASQPCSPDCLKTLTLVSSAFCLPLPPGLMFWITDFKNSVCNFSVLFFLTPCVFLCPLSKSKMVVTMVDKGRRVVGGYMY